jgi:glucose/arabinose dehydrogenase
LVAFIALTAANALFAESPSAPPNADWTADSPGTRHKFTVADLPVPYATKSVDNGPREVRRPSGAEPRVPAGFKIEQYAAGFSYPRYLLTAPNGDIFVTESYQNSIKVLRDSNGDGKPDLTETFADHGMTKPFGIGFYPPGPDPQFLYVANTNGVMVLHREPPGPAAQRKTAGAGRQSSRPGRSRPKSTQGGALSKPPL